MEPGNSFGPRLRQERERRQISLSSIAANTKIGVSLLQGLERDDVRRWPSGIFRRAFIRSYAQAIGLDAETLVREFLERFPDPADPPNNVPAAGAVPHQPAEIDLVLRVRVPRSWANWVRWAFAKRTGVLTVTEPDA